MSYFFSLLKVNAKLLLRNKGFIFFLLITPIISGIVMSLHVDSAFYESSAERSVVDITDSTNKIVYLNDWKAYSIKVYDAADTKLSMYLLEKLSESGMFCVYRTKADAMTEQDVLESASQEAMNDRIGTILYLKPGFNENVINGNFEDAFLFYGVSDDERWELLESFFTDMLSAVRQTALLAGSGEEELIAALDAVEEYMPDKEIVSLDGKNEISLTTEQSAKKGLAGYAYSIMTLGFMFCGVCIAHTVIEERDNKMYTRVMMTKAGRGEYLLSKFCMSLLASILQTAELAIYMFLFRDLDFGIQKPAALLFIFLLGLIFNVFSLELGIIIGDVMGANYAAFAVWSLSSLLSGAYFPIEDSSNVVTALSNLMPQRWFLKGTELLMTGDKSVYSTILCVTLAYMIIIFCIGAVGLRMKESEA